MLSGIYKFINRTNGKMYIGSAVSLANRKKNHLIELRLNRHHNRYLQAAWNKYGSENIAFEVMEYCDRSDLINREQLWITWTRCFDRQFGYNLSPTASSPLGVRHSDETRAKASKARKGKAHSEEWNRNVSIALKGMKASDSARQNISKALKGRSLTEEHRSNISAAQRKLGKWPHLMGWACKCTECKAKRKETLRLSKLKLLPTHGELSDGTQGLERRTD